MEPKDLLKAKIASKKAARQKKKTKKQQKKDLGKGRVKKVEKPVNFPLYQRAEQMVREVHSGKFDDMHLMYKIQILAETYPVLFQHFKAIFVAIGKGSIKVKDLPMLKEMIASAYTINMESNEDIDKRESAKVGQMIMETCRKNAEEDPQPEPKVDATFSLDELLEQQKRSK